MAGGQRADEPSCRQVGRHADQGQAQAGRACARGRHGTWRASPALLAARVPPTLRRVGGGAPRTGLQLGRGGFGVGGGCRFGIPELAVGTMGGAGAHDPWATAKHASGVRRALTLEERAPPILDLRRAKNTVALCCTSFFGPRRGWPATDTVASHSFKNAYRSAKNENSAETREFFLHRRPRKQQPHCCVRTTLSPQLTDHAEG